MKKTTRYITCLIAMAFMCGLLGMQVSADTLPTVGSSTKLGDVNADGTVDAADYMITKAYAIGSYRATEEEIYRMDVVPNGKVDSFDWQIIRTIVLKQFAASPKSSIIV